MSEPAQARIAIVAALEREVRPLTKRWRVTEREHGGRSFRFFENRDAVLICGGIGAEAARRAAEAAIAVYSPKVIYSVGFAGALDPASKVGSVIQPAQVIDATDGSRVDLPAGDGSLVTFPSVATPEQKAKLRDSFRAQAVDMEAAAVARAAEARGVPFAAVKAISDDSDFDFPSMERFVDSAGAFQEVQFATYVALRPWLWARVIKLARNSSTASHALCERLQAIISQPSSVDSHAVEASNRK